MAPTLSLALFLAATPPPCWSQVEKDATSGEPENAATSEPAVRGQLIYTGDTFLNAVGGASRGIEYTADISAAITIDAHALLGWEGATLFFYALDNYGDNPSERVSDLQGVSNIAAPEELQIYEAWVQQNVARAVSVLVGLYDLNSEFDVIDAAGLFLNSSFGIGAEFGSSGRNGPSIFPATSFGARLSGQPVRSLFVRAAVLDGVPGDPQPPEGIDASQRLDEGLLLAGEAALLAGGRGEAVTARLHVGRGRQPAPYRAKLALGVWHYTGDFIRLRDDPDSIQEIRTGSTGVYALLEHALRPEGRNPGQGLSGFLRVGWADPEVNRIAGYAGGGIVYDGLIPGRDHDRLGLGFAAAFLGDPAREGASAAGRASDAAEITLELTYLGSILERLTVQPDVQYVINPGAEPRLSNALVLALRFQATL